MRATPMGTRRSKIWASTRCTRALPSYVIIMGGGAIVNMSYCFIRLACNERDFARAPIWRSRAA